MDIGDIISDSIKIHPPIGERYLFWSYKIASILIVTIFIVYGYVSESLRLHLLAG